MNLGHSAYPPSHEIVPLLSGVLARCSILPLGGFTLPGGLDDQQIMRQHQESHLDPHPLQAAAAEATQAPVSLGIREPQLDRLASLPVDRLGLRRLHLRLMRYDQILMFIPLDRPTVRTPCTPRRQGAGLTVFLGTTIGRQDHRTPFGTRTRLPAGRGQPMALRADIGLFPGQPDEFALGDLSAGSLAAPPLRLVVLLI